MQIENRAGGYSFLKGISPYSAGVMASRGFDIAHYRGLPYLRYSVDHRTPGCTAPMIVPPATMTGVA